MGLVLNCNSPKGLAFVGLLSTLPPTIAYLIIHFLHVRTIFLWAPLGLLWSFLVKAIVVPFFTSELRRLPRPPNNKFLWGNIAYMLQKPAGSGHLRAAKETPNDGLVHIPDTFHLPGGVMLTTPEAVMEVLNTREDHWRKPNKLRVFLERIVGRGLVTSEGVDHKIQRRTATPAFAGRYVKDLVPLFSQKANDLTNFVADKVSRDPVLDVARPFSLVTLDIIGVACVGKDFGAIRGQENELARCYEWLTDTSHGPFVAYAITNNVLGPWITDLLPWKFAQDFLWHQKRVRVLIKDLLAEKKLAKEINTAEEKDIISIIMRQDSVSDDYLTEQLLTFLAAGHETTASAMEWACYCLSTRPEYQTRLRDECRQYLTDVTKITADILDQMPFMEAVIMETLRLYPPASITIREAVRDTKLCDTFIPEGTHVFISPWAIQRLPSFWGADAEDFRPDRWLDGSTSATGSKGHPNSFIAFIYGARSCIGQAFAKYEFKCLLAAFVMRFSFEMNDATEVIIPDGLVTIKPKGGLRLRITELETS